jgi:uncharacterized membrane protein YeaQ/YmgE (transglycosylase-associated protein family)
MTLTALLIYIVIAAICGAIGNAIAGGRGGFIISFILGFIGAILGPWIAKQLHLAEPFFINIGGHRFGILWSIIGAAVFVLIVHLFTRRRGRR